MATYQIKYVLVLDQLDDSDPVRWSVEAEDTFGANIGAISVTVLGEGRRFISSVGVRDDWKRKGVARALFERLIAESPAGETYGAMAETPEGRVFLEAMQTEHPGRLSFTSVPEAMADPEDQ
jgi:GNAT superfamily N-acetyltransferase